MKPIVKQYKPLLKLLIDMNMNPREFADKVGITQSALRQILVGRRKGLRITRMRINEEWEKLKTTAGS